MGKPSPPRAPRDFDFLFGHWRVRNERMKQRLAGCGDWETFETCMQCHPVLGGMGNVEEHVSDEFSDSRWIGMALRLFDPRTRRWRIHWADNHSGVLEPPGEGAFAQGIGTFFGRDHLDEVPVLTRFLWDSRDGERPCWEQAFSIDEGTSWETNWIMNFDELSRSEPTT